MALKSLNQLRAFRNSLLRTRDLWLRWKTGVVLGDGVSISLSARFVPARRGHISVGAETLVAFWRSVDPDSIRGHHATISTSMQKSQLRQRARFPVKPGSTCGFHAPRARDFNRGRSAPMIVGRPAIRTRRSC